MRVTGTSVKTKKAFMAASLTTKFEIHWLDFEAATFASVLHCKFMFSLLLKPVFGCGNHRVHLQLGLFIGNHGLFSRDTALQLLNVLGVLSAVDTGHQ